MTAEDADAFRYCADATDAADGDADLGDPAQHYEGEEGTITWDELFHLMTGEQLADYINAQTSDKEQREQGDADHADQGD